MKTLYDSYFIEGRNTDVISNVSNGSIINEIRFIYEK